MAAIDRRKFITLSLAGTAAALSPRCAKSLSLGSLTTSKMMPTRYVSQGGLLDLGLQARRQTVRLGDRAATLLTYNGQVPGPLLEVQAGDTVQLKFENQLEQPTNLHFHGLHIPPTGHADNVFLVVPVGAIQHYEFEVPKQHPGGLFWYHPHYHGLVAEQVFGGLAGPLIVRGQVDEIPEIQAAHEAILVLQDFDLDRQGELREPMPMFRRWGRQGGLMTANGTRQPTVTIPRSGLLRLRLLNASASRIYRLRLQGHPWHLIGLDSGTLPEPVELTEDLILAPGERADLLVPGNREPGAYTLVSLPYDRGIAHMMGGLGRAHHRRLGTGADPQAIAQLQYGETAIEVPLPKTLLPTATLPTSIRQREFVLDHGIAQGQSFLINGQGFEHDRIDTTVQLGTVEDWRIVNNAGMDHPFHIHTNAFQITRQGNRAFPLQVWKDVVNVKAYESVDLRIAFTDFEGKTLYHCHILDHEDQGMMGILSIQPGAV
ncbi:MAG: multicopper oxidase family protein [Leptolyngbyaceae cyanobacterium]